MRYYITRHGQIFNETGEQYDHMFPPEDEGLSALGKKQAMLLGKRMKEIGFKGIIVSSPYIRCLETSELIARETGCTILPYAPMREIFRARTEEDLEKCKVFKGLSLDQIREKFDYIDPECTLEYPWWPKVDENFVPEKADTVKARVAAGVKALEEKYPNTEFLFVGHGASSMAMLRHFEIPQEPYWSRRMLFNCSLSMIDPADPEGEFLYCDTDHMLYEETTSNHLTREEYDQKGFDEEWDGELELPAGIDEITGTKILHIGDTYSKFYPYFRKLINEIKPDIILHTGDMADEVKVGRIPSVRYEYNSKIRRLLEVMDHSGARLIIVRGNNDVPEEIKALCPRAEVYDWDTEIVLDGQECRIGHLVTKMTFDKKWSFYGHNTSSDEWKYEYNVPGQPCRFNAMWGAFLYCLSENKFFRLGKRRLIHK